MNGIVAIQNKKILEQLKKKNKIKINQNIIYYKEAILEILEENKKIEFIIFDENLSGNLKIEKLIQKIKEKNNQIKIAIVLHKEDKNKKEYLKKNKIHYFLQDITVEKIINFIIPKQTKIIAITGTEENNKTITIYILAELLRKNNRILIIEDLYQQKFTELFFQIKNNQKNKILELKNNLFVFFMNYFLNNKKTEKNKILFEVNKIKNNYDYILINLNYHKNYFYYQEIIQENILILNANLLEVCKIKPFILKNNKNISVILYPYSEKNINEYILKQIFKNKIKIIEKIKYNENYSLLWNHQINLFYLDQKTKNKYLKIIEHIK